MPDPVVPLDPDRLDAIERHARRGTYPGESETLNLGSHGEQIGHWYPVKSPLYRLVPYQPEDPKNA